MFEERPKYDNPRYRNNPDYADNIENRSTPKKYYPSRTGNYSSWNRDLPQRRFVPDSRYQRPAGHYTTPPKNKYDTMGDDYLEQTRPRPRYDYLYEDNR